MKEQLRTLFTHVRNDHFKQKIKLCQRNGCRKIAPEENCRNPSSKPNSKPNPNPNRGTIFLEGSCPDTQRIYLLKKHDETKQPRLYRD